MKWANAIFRPRDPGSSPVPEIVLMMVSICGENKSRRTNIRIVPKILKSR